MDELTEQILAEKENVDIAPAESGNSYGKNREKRLLNWQRLPLFFTTSIMG